MIMPLTGGRSMRRQGAAWGEERKGRVAIWVPQSASGRVEQAVGLDLRAVILARDTDLGEQEGILKITYSDTLIFANEELMV